MIDITQTQKISSSGLTVGLAGGVADMALDAAHSIHRGSQVKDDRLSVLYATKAAYDIKDAASGIQGASKMSEPRDRYSGDTMSEYIAKVPNELPIDAVGLWQIVPYGRHGFGLEGGELVSYVRRNLYALLERGAKPVVGATDGIHYWQLQNQYGTTIEEIANTVIDEWLASGGGDPDPGGLWFALPELYEMTKAQERPTTGCCNRNTAKQTKK